MRALVRAALAAASHLVGACVHGVLGVALVALLLVPAADSTRPAKAMVALPAPESLPTVFWDGGRRLPLPAFVAPSLTTSGSGSGYLQIAYTGSGIFHLRSSTGVTWTKPTRLSPSSQHADWAAMAASGSAVHVAWSSADPDPATDKVVLYARTNLTNGSGAWGPIRRLTPLIGAVGIPSIAAAGSSVYVAYTDLINGSIKVAISSDRGVTWRRATLARVTGTDSDVVPSVAAAGRLVLVAWRDRSSGAVKARMSTDGGAAWLSVVTLAGPGSCAIDICSPLAKAAATPGRGVVAWDEQYSTTLRVWRSGAWGPRRLDGASGYLAGVAVTGSTGIAIGNNLMDRVTWSESPDQGVTWSSPSVVAGGEGYGLISMVWPTPTVRYALLSYYEQGVDDDIQSVALYTGHASP